MTRCQCIAAFGLRLRAGPDALLCVKFRAKRKCDLLIELAATVTKKDATQDRERDSKSDRERKAEMELKLLAELLLRLAAPQLIYYIVHLFK